MCCGNRRSAWRSGLAAPTPRNEAEEPARSPAVAVPDLTPSGPGISRVRLLYSGRGGMRVSGPITGRPYTFSGERPVQEVDVRDAAMLVRNARLGLSVSS